MSDCSRDDAARPWDEWPLAYFSPDDYWSVSDWAAYVLWPNRRGKYHIGSAGLAWFENDDDALWFKLVWGK